MPPPTPGRPAAGKNPPPVREMTRLESDEEIRQALHGRRLKVEDRPVEEAAPPAAASAGTEPEAERPIDRPPMGRLCILDDGNQDGEWVRIRADRTVLGRGDGDIRIPHDAQMSGKHAEIVRQRRDGGFRWRLVDLQSTNGTFVRIGSTILRHESELLIGAGRYRFEAESEMARSAPPEETEPRNQSTRSWAGESGRTFAPSLVEMAPAGPVQRYTLTLPEYWIGRDARSCPIARPDDALMNARHARLFRDAKGIWHVENHKSLNGLWLRVLEPIPIGDMCRFRLGEQQFAFRVLK